MNGEHAACQCRLSQLELRHWRLPTASELNRSMLFDIRAPGEDLLQPANENVCSLLCEIRFASSALCVACRHARQSFGDPSAEIVARVGRDVVDGIFRPEYAPLRMPTAGHPFCIAATSALISARTVSSCRRCR